MRAGAPRQLLSVALALIAAASLGACGSSHSRTYRGDNTGAGGVNSVYLNVGNLIYQVQLSRELNPTDPEDMGYLTGVPARGLHLAPMQMWFGVFLLVQDRSKHPGPSATTFVLSDTQGDVYRPLPLSPANPFAYRPATLHQGEQIPTPSSIAADGPTQASLLLFQLPVGAYDNRPLVLRIESPTNPAQGASVVLDV